MLCRCVPCYQEIKGEEIEIGGTVLKKSELIKDKNDKVRTARTTCCVLSGRDVAWRWIDRSRT